MAVSWLRRIGANVVVRAHAPLFRAFRARCESPEATQGKLIEHLQKSFSSTSLSRLVSFRTRSVSTADEAFDAFQESLPLTDYAKYEAYFEKMRECAEDRSWVGKLSLLMYGLTSGTTGSSKYIPVTRASLRAYKHAWTLWGFSAFTSHPLAAAGRFLQFGGSWQKIRTGSGVWGGAMSGLTSSMQSAIVRRNYVLPPQWASIEDFKCRYYVAALQAFQAHDLSFIVTANPLTLNNFFAWTNDWADDLLRDMHDGTITGGPWRGDAAGAAFRTPANRTRSRALGRVFSGGCVVAKEIWPNLTLVSTWTGGTMGRYLPELKSWLGNSVALRDPGFVATEGYFAIPLSDDTPDAVLNIDGHVFEFSPVESDGLDALPLDRIHTRLLRPWELEVGRRYELFVSGWNGLFRYRMHDIVLCTGWFGRTPLVRFLSKSSDFCSLSGEKLYASQVSESIRVLRQDLPLFQARPLVLAPRSGTRPGYWLLYGGETNLPESELRRAALIVEASLQSSNKEYEDRIISRRLQPIELRHARSTLFDRVEGGGRDRLGYTFEQQKVRFLLNEPIQEDKELVVDYPDFTSTG